MFLQKGDGIFRRYWSKEGHSERCLFPWSGIAEKANLFRPETLPDPESYRHRWNKLVSCPEATLGKRQYGIQIVLLNSDA